MSKLNGPHQNQPVAVSGADLNEAKRAMIMIHGRGASAQSILGLSKEFEKTSDFIFLAPQASGHTWYPYSFLAPTENNQPGIDSGLQAISNILQKLNEQGIANEHIFLLGFSQGACLASEFVARNPSKYAGLIALSGGLIGEFVTLSEYTGDLKSTPIFMGCSDVDAHIPVDRLDETEKVFLKLNAVVQKNIYQGMGHLVNEDEISNINRLIETSLS
ncbi:MAG: dienelactone hydrolase family protein [Balneolaceae bacterium]